MNILLTGAEGFLGSNLIMKLMDEHEITALDFLKSREKSNLPADIEYINQDLSKMDISKMPAVDLIIHLASISIGIISENPRYASVNMTSTLNVLELARKNSSDVVFSSSGSIYGSGLNFREENPYNPSSLYAVEKMNEENLAKFYHETYGLNIVTLRYTNCYGDTTYLDNKHYPGKKGVIRLFMENALQDRPLTLIADQSRDFTFIDDVVEATMSTIGTKGFEIFNVGTGIETPVYMLPILISTILEKPVKIEFIQPRAIDNLTRRSLSIDKIWRACAWKPKYSLEEGLKIYTDRLREVLK